MTTIKLYNGQTFENMSDSDRQEMATVLINREFGHCFSNVFSTLFAAIDESHVEYDDMQTLQGAYDYTTVVTDHINDLSLYDLLELVNNESLDDTREMMHTSLVKDLKNYLVEYVKWDWKQSTIEDVFSSYSGDEQFMHDEDIEDIHQYMDRVMPEVVNYFSDIDNLDNFIDWAETNNELSDWIGTDLDTIRAACFESISSSDDDLQNYSNNNGLDAEFEEAYEHWIVSSWLSDKLPNTGDVCGLTIWARYCTGQSICLDYNIQQLAFDLYSSEVDEGEHIKKVDAIKAVIDASVKPDMVEYVSKVIFDNTTAYQCAIDASDLDYDQRKALEKRISSNVKKVNTVLESHNLSL
ncbi:hypothetical protein VPDG_00152 [Vibrio phage henriette 12B8]|uniref:hypothetical protein n=1 Tax=Vibrio phage henriette 12B8 TaxID=573174 RepID=UPI0002C07466|nr:hypothetical protein VPDG_00152 [Vibrio phage henriette 12B8]AGG58313.1 hypothetical protein VPDG_00152 [Vibrio phage henriette 12B8]